MKYLILAAVIFTLPCCTTETTTLPDGTVIVKKGYDSTIVLMGGNLAGKALDRTSSK